MQPQYQTEETQQQPAFCPIIFKQCTEIYFSHIAIAAAANLVEEIINNTEKQVQLFAYLVDFPKREIDSVYGIKIPCMQPSSPPWLAVYCKRQI